MEKDRLTKLEKYWILYDVGNSAFTLLVATIIPIYFNYLAGMEGISEVNYLAFWGYASSIATLLVAFLGPVFGTLADTKGFKKPIFLGSLLVGVAFAKALALGCGARFLGVNHLHAHLLAAGLENALRFPALGLLVSGGHTHIYRMESPSRCIVLGRTLDDAAGEAFDKVGKILGLAYPGGRLMDALARQGRADARLFPRPYLDNDNLDFSFSGLKTAVTSYVRQVLPDQPWPHPLQDTADAPQALKDCCASFNLAVVETIAAKVERALAANPDLDLLVMAGGVAANSLLRERMSQLMEKRGGRTVMPGRALCTDNAAMVAYAAWLIAREGWQHELRMETIPRGKAIPDDMIFREL